MLILPDMRVARVCAWAAQRAYAERTIHSMLAAALWVPGERAGLGGAGVLAWKGTDSLRGWVTDAEVSWAEMPYGRVHLGFMESCGSLMDQVLRLDQRERPEPLFITGHSKGAAEALLCAKILAACGRPVAGVYTFGGPRVGDAGWRRSYNKQAANFEPRSGKGERGNGNIQRPTSNIEHPTSNIEQPTLGEVTWRFVNQEDIVARVPIWMSGYRHVGTEVFGSALSGMLVRPALWRKAASDLAGVMVDLHMRRVPLVVDHPVERYVEWMKRA